MRYLAVLITLALASPLSATAEMIWPPGSGCEYIGDVRNGKPHGKGSQRCTHGGRYVGEWRYGKFYGQGTYTWPSGNKYAGNFWDDLQHGQGTLTLSNGDKYVGEFKKNEISGPATFTSANGDTYVGEFKNYRFNGQGTMTYANGGKYIGEFRDGTANGQGTMTYANGSTYVGELRDGLANGQGTMYNADGSLERQGRWCVGRQSDGSCQIAADEAAIEEKCYPAESRQLDEKGIAIVEVTIDEKGKLLSFRLISSSGYFRLDAAVDCVLRKTKFSKKERSYSARMPITFRLE